jgi:ABC-type multidrug transport system ATPase subunit
MSAAPLLQVQNLVKRYQRRPPGWPLAGLARATTFELQATFDIAEPAIVGVMGANGAGKTTLFELMTGGNEPSAGRVLVAGQDIHKVRYGERDRLALHYHQSYQLRRFKRRLPAFMLAAAQSEEAKVHLFDEPQFNAQDGYIGFMLDFFRRLRGEGKVVFLCLHPNEPVHLEILAEVCSRFVFVQKDAAGVSRLAFASDYAELVRGAAVRGYLGALAPSIG